MAIVWVVLALVLLVALYLLVTYNSVIKVRQRIEAGWAQIDVQLKRRHDLVPNLVETVKGYAAHEKETLDRVIAARNSALNAGSPGAKATAETGLGASLKSLFALGEAYPDLKANPNFLQLQEELTATEDKIAYSRQYYNDEVRAYNTKILSFPTSLLAKRFRFASREYFQTAGDERGPVQVKF